MKQSIHHIKRPLSIEITCSDRSISHAPTNNIVMTVATQLMASDSSALPIYTVASVNPTLGKMMVHHVNVKEVRFLRETLPSSSRCGRTVAILATMAMAASQKVKSHKKMLVHSATTRRISGAVGCLAKYPYPSGIASAHPMSETIV